MVLAVEVQVQVVKFDDGSEYKLCVTVRTVELVTAKVEGSVKGSPCC